MKEKAERHESRPHNNTFASNARISIPVNFCTAVSFILMHMKVKHARTTLSYFDEILLY